MISEKKIQIVINNYFKSECSVDTSIRQAFEKGFRIGLKKGLSAQPERKEGEWIRKEVKVYCPRDCWNPSACAIEGTWNEEEGWNLEMQDGFCSVCGEQDDQYYKDKYCPNCGAKMRKGEE